MRHASNFLPQITVVGVSPWLENYLKLFLFFKQKNENFVFLTFFGSERVC
jgi:hypothetical protein